MTAAEHFAAQERRAEAQRGACRIIGHLIDQWFVDYAHAGADTMRDGPAERVSLEVRLELERIRDHMAAAGAPTPQETISP
jgi:hypothetical protein